MNEVSQFKGDHDKLNEVLILIMIIKYQKKILELERELKKED